MFESKAVPLFYINIVYLMINDNSDIFLMHLLNGKAFLTGRNEPFDGHNMTLLLNVYI